MFFMPDKPQPHTYEEWKQDISEFMTNIQKNKGGTLSAAKIDSFRYAFKIRI